MLTLLRSLYSLLLFLALPLIFLRLVWRGIRQRGYWRHVAERLGRYSTPRAAGCIWLHAVSVGEMRATQPLIRQLARAYPERRILVSCMTVTGREVASELYGGQVTCVYLPYDLMVLQNRLIEHFRPALLLIMETEIWPNLLAACRQASVPALLVNARLSEKSRRGYARFAPVRVLTRAALQSLHAVAAQSPADAGRLTSLGAGNITVTGNIKFDAPLDSRLVALGQEWRKVLAADRRVLLAASTRDGEEARLLEAYQRVFSADRRRQVLLVLVPRHPQRFDAVNEVLRASDMTSARRSNGVTENEIEVWLGDSMGEMAAYYSMCDVAFIGGSLLPLGGQNLIEASAQGKPVVMGPSVYNFAEAAHLAGEAGAMRQGNDATAVMQLACEWLHDDARRELASRAAYAFAGAHAGATEKTMGLIAPLLVAAE